MFRDDLLAQGIRKAELGGREAPVVIQTSSLLLPGHFLFKVLFPDSEELTLISGMTVFSLATPGIHEIWQKNTKVKHE